VPGAGDEYTAGSARRFKLSHHNLSSLINGARDITAYKSALGIMRRMFSFLALSSSSQNRVHSVTDLQYWIPSGASGLACSSGFCTGKGRQSHTVSKQSALKCTDRLTAMLCYVIRRYGRGGRFERPIVYSQNS